MTTSLMPLPKQHYTGVAGIPLIGGKVYTYEAGTTTPKQTFTDAAGTTPQANPIILNSRGEPASPIYWDGNYKVEVRDALNNLIYTVDNYNSDPFGISNLVSSSGSSLIGFIQSGVGAVGRTLQDKCRESISLADFLPSGYVTDGSIDYAIQINRAITAAGASGELVWPKGTWLCGQKLTMPQGQRWIVKGAKRSATIKKGFNGDMVEMGALAAMIGINIDAQGGIFSGRGIYVTSGNSQIIQDCRVSLSQGVGLEFAVGAGGGCHVSNFEADTTSPTVVAAIKIAGDAGPTPRFFEGIWLAGGLFDISGAGAGNGCSMSNFYMRNIVFGGPIATGTVLIHFANGRLASGADTTTVSGADISFVGVAFAGPVALNQAQGIRFSACSFGGGVTEDAASCNSNEFFTGNNSYAVTWTQASGVQPSIGDGSLTGWFSRDGRRCLVNIRLVVGATTTFGNAAVGYQFSVPFIATPDFNQRGMFGNVLDVSTPLDYNVIASLGGGTASFTLAYNGFGVRDGFPIAWAAGDTIEIQFEYMVK